MGTKLKDLIRFKTELYFDGAVQIDWAYDEKKLEKVASSFVFHGPEYFGVTTDDIVAKNHRLIDTATFTELVSSKLNEEVQGSPFLLTIAPYGTGKSHLAVALAALFRGDVDLSQKIITNISKIDEEIGSTVGKLSVRPNLVLILNGMRDFNLNYEILSTTQKALKLHNVDSGFLESLTRSYDIAVKFVQNNFDKFSSDFIKAAESFQLGPDNLKTYLCNNILSDTNVFEIINEVYKSVTGTNIRWDEGVSAGDILTKLSETLCGDRGPFNKILVLFDEFGRYIEYAGTYPSRAGDAALQQVYEAVQNSDGNILFVGFIQSDLKTYLTRVDRASNINRYVGRYEASEKIHLSSNLETIFANLLERTDNEKFSNLIVSKLRQAAEVAKWKEFHSDLLRWLPQANKLGVWKDWEHFSKVILEGTFPLHPLTTWILSNMSTWLQQRSSLTFLDNALEMLSEHEINEFGELPFIPATSIVLTDFFQELLSAEQDGRQQSEYCIMYNQILIKQGDKLNSRVRNVLAGLLILRVARLKTKTRDDVIQAVKYASGLKKDEVQTAINTLENEFGVISYDDVAGCFDFVADATGINDYKRLLASKKRNAMYDIKLLLDGHVQSLIGLNNDIETVFDKQNHIHTLEWRFKQDILPIDDLTSEYLKNLTNECSFCRSTDKSKGRVIWLYSAGMLKEDSVDKVKHLINQYNCDRYPIVFVILEDKELKFEQSLVEYQIAQHFTEEERIKFSRFIPEHLRKTETLISDLFNGFVAERLILTSTGISRMEKRLSQYCNDIFSSLYNRVIPFPFDGFTNKNVTNARKNLIAISKIILNKVDYQWIHSQSTEIKNRLEAVLFEGRAGSWGVLNSNYQFISPANIKARAIFEELDDQFNNSENISFKTLFAYYQQPPYGINDYALTLLLVCYLAQHTIDLKINLKGNRIRLIEWGQKVFLDKSIDFEVLLETTIVKVDPDMLSSRYLALYKKVERNNDVDLCPKYDEELKKLLTEEDEPEEMLDKIMGMKLILEEGMKLHDKTKLLIGAQSANLSKAVEGMDYKLAFEILDSCIGLEESIDGSTRYKYNINQLNTFNKIISETKHFIESEFETWLVKSVKCDSVNQVSAFEKWVKHIIDSFNKYGYLDKARKTRSKLEDVTDNLERVRVLQNIKETTNKYLREHNPDNRTSYEELNKWKADGEKLIEILSGEKISPGDRVNYEEPIRERLKYIEGCIIDIRKRVTEIYDLCYEVNDLKGCKDVLNKLSITLSKALHEKDRAALLELGDSIQDIINDIDKLSAYKDNKKLLLEEIELLREKYTGVELDIDISSVIDSVEVSMLNIIKNNESMWVQRNILSEIVITNYSNSDCLKWLDNTKMLPSYLSSETVESYYECKKKVMNQLNKYAVDAVLSLFDNLDTDQKLLCYKALSEKLKVEVIG